MSKDKAEKEAERLKQERALQRQKRKQEREALLARREQKRKEKEQKKKSMPANPRGKKKRPSLPCSADEEASKEEAVTYAMFF